MMSTTLQQHPLAALIGKAIFFSGLQFSIGSVEMSSKYSVENFSKDQATLQNACNALSTYIVIAVIWTLATCLVLYADHGQSGIFWGFVTNFAFAGWIIFSYYLTFKKVAKMYNLVMPKFFQFGYNSSGLPHRVA